MSIRPQGDTGHDAGPRTAHDWGRTFVLRRVTPGVQVPQVTQICLILFGACALSSLASFPGQLGAGLFVCCSKPVNYNERAFPRPGRGPLCVPTHPRQSPSTHQQKQHSMPAADTSCQPHWMLSCMGQQLHWRKTSPDMLPVMVRLRGKEDRVAPDDSTLPHLTAQPPALLLGIWKSVVEGGHMCKGHTQ